MVADPRRHVKRDEQHLHGTALLLNACVHKSAAIIITAHNIAALTAHVQTVVWGPCTEFCGEAPGASAAQFGSTYQFKAINRRKHGLGRQTMVHVPRLGARLALRLRRAFRVERLLDERGHGLPGGPGAASTCRRMLMLTSSCSLARG